MPVCEVGVYCIFEKTLVHKHRRFYYRRFQFVKNGHIFGFDELIIDV